MDKCRECWIHIDNWLWCKRCRKEVDEEIIEHKVIRPFNYYFASYINSRNKSDLFNHIIKWKSWLNC